MLDDRMLDAWISRNYPHGTRLTRAALRELAEDEERHRAQSLASDYRTKQAADQARELAELRKRVARIERMVLDKGGGLGKALVGVVAAVIADERKATRELIDRRIDEELQARCAMVYRGIWAEDVSYDRGAVCTHNGALWIALTATAGERPHKSPDWRLAMKSEPGKTPVMA